MSADGSTGYRAEPAATTCTSRWPARGRTARPSSAACWSSTTWCRCRRSTRSGTGAAGRLRDGPGSRARSGQRLRLPSARPTKRPSPAMTATCPCRSCGTGQTGRIVSNNCPTSPSTWARSSAVGHLGVRPVPGRAAPADRRPQRARLRHSQQRRVPCGFATSQQAYDSAVASLFATLDDLDQRLAAAVPVRRRAHRGRRPAVGDPGPVRPGLRHPLQGQPAPPGRLPEPVAVRA